MQAITHVPRAPEWIRGIINLRGKVIPIVDMNKRFATATTDDTWKTCIVVIQLHGDQGTIPVGLVVDEISEVVTIDSTQLELPPQFQQADEENFIAAMGKIGREVIMLLNVDRVVSERDLMTAAVTEPSI